MRQPSITLAQVERALAAQDQKLAASYEKLDPGSPVVVPLASLQRLAEVCASSPARPRRSAALGWGAVRC